MINRLLDLLELLGPRWVTGGWNKDDPEDTGDGQMSSTEIIEKGIDGSVVSFGKNFAQFNTES